MKRAAIAAALLFVLPPIAQGYTVHTGIGSLNDQQSRFEPIDIGSSRFAERTTISNSQNNDGGSTFGLKNMDAATRLRTETTLSALGAKKEGDRILVSLPGDVLFDFDRSDIRVDARPVLARLASVLEAMPQASVTIVGHTDSKGDDDYNQRLSLNRAASVKAWLSGHGVASRLAIEGKGEASPVAPNTLADNSDNPEGRQKNRRVEFIIGEGP